MQPIGNDSYSKRAAQLKSPFLGRDEKPGGLKMVEWWWLLVEAAGWIAYAWALRGWTRNEALMYALTDASSAQAEIHALPEGYRITVTVGLNPLPFYRLNRNVGQRADRLQHRIRPTQGPSAASLRGSWR